MYFVVDPLSMGLPAFIGFFYCNCCRQKADHFIYMPFKTVDDSDGKMINNSDLEVAIF